MTINLNTGKGVSITMFSDKQPHIRLLDPKPHAYQVICSLTSSDKILELCEVTDAIEQVGGTKSELYIPYLMGARYDRIMKEGDSLDLRVVAKIINSLNFYRVYLFDPHSDVAPALIRNSVVVDNRLLVSSYSKPNAMLIVPDAGAAKKAHNYRAWNPNIVEEVHCVKHRNEKDEPVVTVLEPENCHNRNCVIIDDICDGGRSFINIINQIHEKGYTPASETLIVTHGIFSYGLAPLELVFDEIITSNTRIFGGKSFNSEKLKIIEYGY